MAEIEKIKVGMNTKRTDLIMPKEHKVVITPYWLLEFIVGDGSFSFNSNLNRIMFSLSQKGNEVLLLKIADFLKRTIVQNSTEWMSTLKVN